MVGSERHVCNVTERSRSIHGHPRSFMFVPIESAYTTSYWWSIVTLVLSCTVSEILWFIGRKIAKIASSHPPQSHKSPLLGVTLSNFEMSRIFLETRMFRLSDGEEIMTLAFFVLIQYRSVTDRQSDRRTDGHSSSGYTSACIACCANALVKMAYRNRMVM